MEKSPKSTLKYTEDGEKSMEKSGEKWRKVEKSGEKSFLQTPQFLGIIPDFVKNSMLCTFSLFSCTKYDKVEISIGRKWRKVKNEVEKSGEKSNAYA